MPVVKRLVIGEVVAEIEPQQGAGLRSLRVAGRQLLRPGHSWRLVFDSAGDSTADPAGPPHSPLPPVQCPSRAGWEVYEVARDVAAYSWSDDRGLTLIRWFRLTMDGVLVQTTALNTGRAERLLTVAEQLCLGGSLLADGCRIRPAGTGGRELGPAETDKILVTHPAADRPGGPSPLGAAGEPGVWPQGPDGQDWSELPGAGSPERDGILRGLPDPWIQVAGGELVASLGWDGTALDRLRYRSDGDGLGLYPANTSLVVAPAGAPVGPGGALSWHVQLTASLV